LVSIGIYLRYGVFVIKDRETHSAGCVRLFAEYRAI